MARVRSAIINPAPYKVVAGDGILPYVSVEYEFQNDGYLQLAECYTTRIPVRCFLALKQSKGDAPAVILEINKNENSSWWSGRVRVEKGWIISASFYSCVTDDVLTLKLCLEWME